MFGVLFRLGRFMSAAREPLSWKVECDALTWNDWLCLAEVIGPRLHFGQVEGVPRGGCPLARALEMYATPGGPLLIVDDVLTTGSSMERHRAGRDAIGVVLFARSDCPEWITPVWQLGRAWQR